MNFARFWYGVLMDEAGSESAGGGGPSVGDIAKMVEAISAKIAAQEAAINKRFEAMDKARTVPPAKGDGEGDGEKPTAKEARRIAELEASLKAMEERSNADRKKAEQTARDAAVTSALAGYDFVSDDARDTAFRLFRDQVRAAEDGSHVVGDAEVPIKTWLKEQMGAKHAYLLRPVAANGSGAGNGRPGSQRSINIEDIKPGMKPEELARVRQEIAAVLSAGGAV